MRVGSVCMDCGGPTDKREDSRTKRCQPCLQKATYKRSMREQRLLKTYGIDLARYEEMYESQNGLCAICQQPETFKSRGTVRLLSVDHDHATGLVRGLLCNNCNVGLGNFQEDPRLLRVALAYMEGGGSDG